MAQTEKKKDKEQKVSNAEVIAIFIASVALAVAIAALAVFIVYDSKLGSIQTKIDSIQKDYKKFIPGDKVIPENKTVKIPIYPRQAPSAMIESLKSNAKTAEYYATHRVVPVHRDPITPGDKVMPENSVVPVHREPVANEQPTASLTFFADKKIV